MNRIPALSALCIAALLAGCASAPLEQFPSTPTERIAGSRSQLYVPPGAGRHAAIVLLHTCGGISPRIGTWAEMLAAEGYVVLKVDSFGPRGERGSICDRWTVSVDQVAADALAAAAHLRRLPFVDGGRVAAVGFSYGAMAALRLASASYVQRQKNPVPFRAIVAFYPQCAVPPSAPPQFVAIGDNARSDIATPLHLFLGGQDTEAPSGPCVSHAEARKRDGQPVSYTLFPDATHAFDVDYAPRGYRFNQQAVDASWSQMKEFLAREMK